MPEHHIPHRINAMLDQMAPFDPFLSFSSLEDPMSDRYLFDDEELDLDDLEEDLDE